MITSPTILGGLVLISAFMAIFSELTEEPHLNAPDPVKPGITVAAAYQVMDIPKSSVLSIAAVWF